MAYRYYSGIKKINALQGNEMTYVCVVFFSFVFRILGVFLQSSSTGKHRNLGKIQENTVKLTAEQTNPHCRGRSKTIT